MNRKRMEKELAVSCKTQSVLFYAQAFREEYASKLRADLQRGICP